MPIHNKTFTSLPYPYNLLYDIDDQHPCFSSQPPQISADQKAGIDHALLQLSEESRNCVITYYQSGMSYTDLSRVCQIPCSQVQRFIARSIEKLRRELLAYMQYGYEGTTSRLERIRYDKSETALGKVDIVLLNPSHRLFNSLKRIGISTVADLCNRTESELRESYRMGPKSVNEITALLEPFGLKLRATNEPPPKRSNNMCKEIVTYEGNRCASAR